MSFFKSVKFKIIAVVLAAALLGTATAGITGTGSGIFTRALSVVFMPLQRVAAYVSDGIDGFKGSFASSAAYREQIVELQQRVRELENQLVDYEASLQKLNSYEEFLEIKAENPDYKTVYASVIARDSASLSGSFTINIGTQDGVSVNDPVVYGAANLVGIVEKVNVKTSVVRSVTDREFSVGAYEIRSREDGYISNDVGTAYVGQAGFKGLSPDTAIAEGGIVCTSGVGGICPRDLVIGKVMSVNSDDGSISAFAMVKSNVDLQSMQSVFVITSFAGKGEQ